MRSELLNRQTGQGAFRGYNFRVLASKVHFTAQDETKKDEEERRGEKDQQKQNVLIDLQHE